MSEQAQRAENELATVPNYEYVKNVMIQYICTNDVQIHVKSIKALTENDNVKGVVVRINSPGGSATASEAVRRALAELAEEKPVVYSMGRVAASGGYWITCTGQPILAEVGTITGSIGVFSMRMQFGPLMRRIGLHNDLVALDEGDAQAERRDLRRERPGHGVRDLLGAAVVAIARQSREGHAARKHRGCASSTRSRPRTDRSWSSGRRISRCGRCG